MINSKQNYQSNLQHLLLLGFDEVAGSHTGKVYIYSGMDGEILHEQAQ